MQLITEESVLKRMNLIGISNTANGSNVTAITSAIEGATINVENLIRTSLKLHSNIDYFSIYPYRYSNATQKIVLQLSQRFLTATPVKMYRKPDNANYYEKLPIASMVEIPTTQYVVDKNRGTITWLPPFNIGLYNIAIEYQAGFKELDSKIPIQIQECAILSALAINYVSAVTVGKRDTKSNADALFRAARNSISSLLTSNSTGIYPALIEVVK